MSSGDTSAQQQRRIDDAGDDEEEQEEEIVATDDMCHYCFDTLLNELLPESSQRKSNKRKPRDPNIDGDIVDIHDVRDKLLQQASYSPPAVHCPLFVTWSKLRSNKPPILSEVSSSGLATPSTTTASSSNITDDDENETSSASPSQHDNDNESDYDLRGCIGTLAPKLLKYALSEFAITSAMHDQRFDPIELHELPYLRVGVSLLVKYEECDHCFDWQVGVHGIIIKFEGVSSRKKSSGVRDHNQRTYSATYLPEVAYEQRWSQEEAVVSLIRKAGYRGVISDELLGQVRCTRYQSSKYRLSYQEYAVVARHRGLDPLKDANVMTAAAVDEAMRQQQQGRGKSSMSCVNL